MRDNGRKISYTVPSPHSTPGCTTPFKSLCCAKLSKFTGGITIFFRLERVNKARCESEILLSSDIRGVCFGSGSLKPLLKVVVEFLNALLHQAFMHGVPQSTILFLLGVFEACGTIPIEQHIPSLFIFTPLPDKVTRPKHLRRRIKLIRVLIYQKRLGTVIYLDLREEPYGRSIREAMLANWSRIF